MIHVPGDTYAMGCEVADFCLDNSQPPHSVTLVGFYVDRTEVTVDAYSLCVIDGTCSVPEVLSSECNWAKVGRESHPMNCLSWFEAKTYCEWSGKRLPTEAEWEYAARGFDGRLYPWGNSIATCDNAVMFQAEGGGCGTQLTWPVCSKPDGNSPFGLCDMAGNVSEWVSDWYDAYYYSDSPSNNPQGPALGTSRVNRGGGFTSQEDDLYATARFASIPSSKSADLGFRCVK